MDASEDDLPMFRLGSKRTDPIVVEVNVSGVPVSMEVDTGAAVSVMSQEQQQELFPAEQLQPTRFTLRTYSAERMEVVGELHVVYGDQEKVCHVSCVTPMILSSEVLHRKSIWLL